MIGILSIPTKGILGKKGFNITMGSLLIHIEQGLLIPGSSVWSAAPEEERKKKKYIRVDVEYNGNIYSNIQYTNSDRKVTASNLNIEIIDDKPSVEIDFIESSPKERISVKIKFNEDE